MPVPFEFGGFRSVPAARPNPVVHHPPHHPSPVVPPVGFGSIERGLLETPFLSAKGSLLSHVELSREVRMVREEKEEAKRGMGLHQAANKRVDAELIDLQTTFLQVQAQLDEYFGAGNVPAGIQSAVDTGEKQLTQSRQGLWIQESHRAALVAQFRGDPLLTSEEQTRLRSLVKDQKDRQTVTKGSGGGGRRGGGQGIGGVKGGKVNPPKPKSGPKPRSVSGSSQLIASSVSSGLVLNVARPATCRRTAKNPKPVEITPPPVVGFSCCPPGPSGQG